MTGGTKRGSDGRLDMIRWRVLLQGGHTFIFDVQDWDIEDERLADEEAFTMARRLLGDRVALYGMLSDGVLAVAQIDPEHVVGLVMEQPS